MKDILPTRENIKILGRTIFDNGALWLLHSASSIAFYVEAKTLTLCLVGDGVSSKSEAGVSPISVARYAVYIDDELFKTGTVDSLLKTELVFENAESLRKKVTLVKLTESSQSYFGIKSIAVDNEGKVFPVEENQLKIEFIGDSITCGYGVSSKDENEEFCTQTEDSTKTYAWLCTKALSADAFFTSYSSFGVTSGWTDSGAKNDFSLVPRIYENLCFSWNTKQFEGKTWNFAQFSPQLIVLNLGTNDSSYCKSKETCAEFVESYVAFLKRLRVLNKDAFFVCTIGIMQMGDCMSPFVKEAVERYRVEAKDTRAVYFHFSPQKKEEGNGTYS